MTTKRKFPSVSVPLSDREGHVVREWYESLVRESHIGTPATAALTGTATALPALPAGYLTITVNGADKLFPFYNIPP